MAFPKFQGNRKQESESTPAKTANLLKTPLEQRPERDSAPSPESAKPVLNLLNSDTNPWQVALSQVEALAARLVELKAEALRVDVNGRGSRGYRSLSGLAPEQVHQLVQWLLTELSKQYPAPRSLAIIGQGRITPGNVPNHILFEWQAEHQPAKPEPAPQLAPWARAVLEGADRWRVSYPLLLELTDPEPETKSLSRLCDSRTELERTLAELSRYHPQEVCLLQPGTTKGDMYDVARQEWFWLF